MQNYDPFLYTHTPLNQMVDAVGAESYKAYRFNQKVETWIQTRDQETKSMILATLEQWIEDSDQVRSASDGNELLRQILPHTESLAELSVLAIRSLEDKIGPEEKNNANVLLEKAAEETWGIKLAVVPGLSQLILSGNK